MAWVYCKKCGEGMDPPTTRQVLADDWACAACHHPREVGEDDRRDALLDILDRVEAVEKSLGIDHAE